MIVVGLTGKAGAGKSTVANYLVEKHGFTRLSFAGPLKKMLRTLDPIVGTVNGQGVGVPLNALFEHLGEDENAVKSGPFGPEYRRLLQVLGTDCIRAVDEQFWVKAAMAQLTDPAGRYVFDDVRFPNEAAAIWQAQTDTDESDVFYVARPGHGAGADTHASEQHAGNMGETHTITNKGTLESTYMMVDYLLDMTVFRSVPA